jgi:hypothetical protein
VEDRISGLKDKVNITEKTEEFLDKRSKSCERICKKSVIPLKNQTCESWVLKENRYKPKVFVIYSKK